MAQRAGEKSWEAAISSGRWWNLFPKPGFDISVFCNVSMSNRDFFMTALYLEALAAIAASLSVVTAGAWVVQQPTRDSGWGDTIWTLSLGLVGVGGALWPVGGVPAMALSRPPVAHQFVLRAAAAGMIATRKGSR
jgi:hypothetical protein